MGRSEGRAAILYYRALTLPLLAEGRSGLLDTIGAMACAISGAYLGIEAIPEEWTAKLENRKQIERLATDLARIEK